MKKYARQCSSIKTVFMLAAAVTLLAPGLASATNLWWVKGGNWADDSDNFQTGLIIPAGLSSSSTTADAKSKADEIASNLSYVGGNFVRIGINPASVASSSWWPVMQAFINELVAKGFYVDLCCWGSSSSKGTIDNFSDWETMWETVDSVYSGNWNIFYEPFNEPHGYSTTALLNNVYAPFIGIIRKSQQRVILDGTGYSDHIAAVGADSRFTTCDLGLHDYAFWDTNLTTEAEWQSQFNGEVGGYQGRAVITEMGAPATTGLNYGQSSSNYYISFIRGVLEEANSLQIGVVYWPSHKDGDSYRLFVDTVSGQWTNWSLMTELESLW